MLLRIHGDNIIECERTVRLVVKAFEAQFSCTSTCLYLPRYKLHTKDGKIINLELMAGHDRWGVSIPDELIKNGAPLREGADAYISIVDEEINIENLVIAIEYCSALPAGNNAWQRNGRALSCALAGLPYLYFAEIGGVELDNERNIKAPRFPNPIVPFSYLTASRALKVYCLPVYQAHEAISNELRTKFQDAFGLQASLLLLKLIIDKKDVTQPIKEIEEKGLALVNILSDGRSRIDTYRNDEWKLFLNNITGVDKADWIDKLPNKQIWKKKSSEKISVTKTFKLLLAKTQSLNCLSIGAKDIPICLLSKQQTNDFCSLLVEIYKSEVIISFVKKINKSMPLLIIWITGFKPRGDDSRPDRGLLPLARMLFGNDINILSIVCGPAKSNTWDVFYNNPEQLSLDNGLWQAVMGLSDFVLADSITSKYGILTYLSNRNKEIKPKEIKFKGIKKSVIFSEHDIDTSIHSIFTRVTRERIFESMCNPPGGDWSGISYYNFDEEKEYRWTSLPRVSADKAKRPDHIIQIDSDGDIIFLVIESKNYASNLEENIGIRLKSYINTLFNILPTAIKKSNKNWELYSDKNIPIKKKIIFSGGAYIYRSSEELKRSLEDGKLDFILAFEYFDYNSPAILHICVIKECRFLLPMISSLCERFGNGVKIQVH